MSLRIAVLLVWIAVAGFCGSGCASGSREVSDPNILARLRTICVLPFVGPDGGLSTACLRSDGTVLTVSHALPRGKVQGNCVLGWREVTYTVASSGDGLTSQWHDKSRADQVPWSLDWAVLTTSPRSSSAGPEITEMVAATEVPAWGEDLYLIGYTGLGDRPHVVRVRVIEPPKPLAPARADGLIWIEAESGSEIRRGYSGGPLVRLKADGTIVHCGMLRGAGFTGAGRETRLGVAIAMRQETQ
jgi:hypothetical protein